MSDAGLVDRMQLFAYTPTQKLYFDASETQRFYLYTLSTKTAQVQTGPQALSFWKGASWTLPGTTSWGYTTENNTAINNTPLTQAPHH